MTATTTKQPLPFCTDTEIAYRKCQIFGKLGKKTVPASYKQNKSVLSTVGDSGLTLSQVSTLYKYNVPFTKRL